MFNIQTPVLVLINICLLCLLYYRTYQIKSIASQSVNYKWIYVIMLICCIFAFWDSDWFHYKQYYDSVVQGMEPPMEAFYLWLMKNVCPNYLTFRIIVWGVATFFLIKTFKRVDADYSSLLFIFSIFFFSRFSYSRVSLAMAIMFYGISLFLGGPNEKKYPVLGFLLVFLSFFLHKSSLFGIAAIALAYLFRNNKRSIILISFIALPVVIILMQSFLGSYIDIIVADEGNFLNEYMTTGVTYLDREKIVTGIGLIIYRLFERIPYYLIAIACGKSIWDNMAYSNPTIKVFFRITFILVLLSSVFLFNLDMNTDVVYSRFLRFAQIPAAISFAYLSYNKLYPKLCSWIWTAGIISTAYSLLYSFYNTFYY